MSNVGYATLQVIPSAKGFGRALDGQVSSPLGESGRKGGKRFGGGLIAGLKGPMLALGGTLAAAGIGTFLKGAIGAASDLNETGTKIEAIFGQKASQALQKYAADSARSLGQSKQAALDAAATFGVFGKSAGLTGTDLVGFSTKLTTLATDMASFGNTSPEEAVTALSAALRGEAEPIRKYGVLLDAMSIKNEAVRLGIIKSTKEALTPQARVLAVQSLIMKQTTDQQGDFARTSGGLANQQRILAAQFTNLKTKIGSAFLPIAVKVVSLLNSKLFPAFEAIGKIVSVFWGAFTGHSELNEFGGFLKTVNNAGVKVYETFQKLTGGTAGVQAKFSAFRAVLAQVWATLKPLVLQLVDLWRTLVAAIVPAVMSVYTSIATALVPILQALADTFQRNIAPALSHLIEVLKMVLPPIIKIIAWVLKLAIAILKVVLPPLLKLAGWLIGTLFHVLANLITWIVDVVKAIGKIGSAIGGAVKWFGRFLSGAKDKVGALYEWLVGLPDRIIHKLGDLGKTLLSAGGDLISGFIQGIKDKAGDLVNAIKDSITNKLPGFVKKALGISSPSKVFADLGKWSILGYADGIAKHSGAVTSALGAAIAPPRAPDIAAGGGVAGGLAAMASTPVTVPLYLDGEKVAESVFTIGGREYGYGRKV